MSTRSATRLREPEAVACIDTVYLEDLRCDGSGHGGCQAGCKLYWKEAWLRRVDDDSGAVNPSKESLANLEHLAQAGTRTVRELKGERSEVWRCQATEAFNASELLKTSESSTVLARTDERQFRSAPFHRPCGPRVRHGDCRPYRPAQSRCRCEAQGSQSSARESRSISKPGDLVQVRSPTEIAATLDEGRPQPRAFISTARCFPIAAGPSVLRTGCDKSSTTRPVACSKSPRTASSSMASSVRASEHPGRWFCPRQIYAYWREAWLRRVEEPDRTA